MNILWVPPVSIDDLNALSSMLRASPGIVSVLDDFGSGDWERLFHEHVRHGTEFHAHLDANFLSDLLRLFSPAPLTDRARQAAAVMCLAISFDMKVNPTFAAHEYAFTGIDAPDPHLAGFYYLENLNPQQLADIALGRQRQHRLPTLDDLSATKHEGTHREYLRGYGLAYASMLKIVELHRCTSDLSGRNDLLNRVRRAEALLDWMYHDFQFCGSALRVADSLWGRNRRKTVLKKIDTCNASNVLAMCKNAAWDIVLAENWAESESKREPGDPIHLIFTFDKVLRQLATQLLVTPEQQSLSRPEVVLEKYRRSWPEKMAASLTERYLRYERTLNSPLRVWNSDNCPAKSGFIDALEQRICAGLPT
jgi:hypothetical protein